MNLDRFFKDHPYITQSGLSAKSGISYITLRQIMMGKDKGPEALKLIQKAIHDIGQELLNVTLDTDSLS